jgi:hypothetical protein
MTRDTDTQSRVRSVLRTFPPRRLRMSLVGRLCLAYTAPGSPGYDLGRKTSLADARARLTTPHLRIPPLFVGGA